MNEIGWGWMRMNDTCDTIANECEMDDILRGGPHAAPALGTNGEPVLGTRGGDADKEMNRVAKGGSFYRLPRHFHPLLHQPPTNIHPYPFRILILFMDDEIG